jgi:hypothetical protein
MWPADPPMAYLVVVLNLAPDLTDTLLPGWRERL